MQMYQNENYILYHPQGSFVQVINVHQCCSSFIDFFMLRSDAVLYMSRIEFEFSRPKLIYTG